jgi:hypothetical protein
MRLHVRLSVEEETNVDRRRLASRNEPREGRHGLNLNPIVAAHYFVHLAAVLHASCL